ncbi:oplophorus-luciferin 2-monooxygenase non-catalytic subunit-like [Panulirus ornatus]|uniref:oplophorus-luciferin 2-monooxygenase non-catalytic subunit-like n=1 Tax=Panulirus ornatus TaxID=150431 RepID=UPI003A8C2E5C
MGRLHGYEVLLVLGSYWGRGYGGDAAVSQNIMDVPSSLPCPAEHDIFPCVCYASEDYIMDLDCSAVASEAELAQIFGAHFPFPQFRNFTITGNVNLKVLRAGVFGENSFEGIYVMYGDLEKVEEGAFFGSYSTATTMVLHHNKITSFPFQEIERFTNLRELRLNHNDIPEWQPMASKTLQRLHIGNNPFGSLPKDAFVAMPSLRKIFFLKTNLQKISSGTFSEIPDLWYVDISRNQLTHIPEYTVVLTGQKKCLYIHELQRHQNSRSSRNLRSVLLRRPDLPAQQPTDGGTGGGVASAAGDWRQTTAYR